MIQAAIQKLLDGHDLGRDDARERAVREVRPYCVDVASGVERAPGIKDLGAVGAFIDAARR